MHIVTEWSFFSKKIMDKRLVQKSKYSFVEKYFSYFNKLIEIEGFTKEERKLYKNLFIKDLRQLIKVHFSTIKKNFYG